MAADLALDLDRSSPVPLYFQVAQQIEQAIERGDLGPGSRLDNEILLADRHGLSRPTMRRAIQELVGKGLLVRRRGVGTQVVHNRVNRRVELTSLYDDLARSHQRPATRILLHETASAPDEAAVQLNLPVGSAVVHLERLRFATDEPLAILRNWLPPAVARFTAADLEKGGLYGYLRGTGIRICVAGQRIGARSATAEESRLLGVKRGAPLLTMERTTFDDTGRVIEYGRHVYRADAYSFETTLVERG
jgi:DNA-binding GntR family transcriptional regulator